MWHGTCDMLHLTHDFWQVVGGNGLWKYQLTSSYGFVVLMFEDMEEKEDLINEWQRRLYNSSGYTGSGKLRRGTPYWYQTPSWISLPPCKKQKLKLHSTPDMWHLTHDMWHVTHDWGWTFSQNFRSPALMVWDRQCLKDSEQKYDWLNELMN